MQVWHNSQLESPGQRSLQIELQGSCGFFPWPCAQLLYLATYVKGMGLEDPKGCERFVSKSNGLALSLCYASIFHQQQKIAEFICNRR